MENDWCWYIIASFIDRAEEVDSGDADAEEDKSFLVMSKLDQVDKTA